MTHFTVLVLTNSHKTVEELMAPYDEAGECFRDAIGDRPASRWDWYVVGGRWTGKFSSYDPDKDPLNYSVCYLCGGTGTRPDLDAEGKPDGTLKPHRKAGYRVAPMSDERAADLLAGNLYITDPKRVPAFMAVNSRGKWAPYSTGCNGCYGSGAMREFHNRETDEANDVLPVAEILDKYPEKTTHAVLTPDGEWHEKGECGWFGTTIGPEKEEDEWKKEFRSILEKHRDLTATLIDAHV